MNRAQTIMAAVELVKEGHLGWHQAAEELRAELNWTMRELYTSGAAELLQRADTEFMARMAKARMARILSGTRPA